MDNLLSDLESLDAAMEGHDEGKDIVSSLSPADLSGGQAISQTCLVVRS